MFDLIYYKSEETNDRTNRIPFELCWVAYRFIYPEMKYSTPKIQTVDFVIFGVEVEEKFLPSFLCPLAQNGFNVQWTSLITVWHKVAQILLYAKEQ